MNAQAWHDTAVSQRWIGIPGDTSLQAARSGWTYPDGTVLAKTISVDLPLDSTTVRARLETQLLHREDGSWRPYSYRWNADQTDAELVPAEGTTWDVASDAHAAAVPTFRYRIAGRAECQICHNPWVERQATRFGRQSATPLAVSVAQWNKTVTRGGDDVNQLDWLSRHGWLDGQLPGDLSEAPRLADPYDDQEDISRRARAYLHVNCAHCHRPNAGGTATIRMMEDISLDEMQAVDAEPKQGSFGIASARIIAPGDPYASVLWYRMAKVGGGRMPRLGSAEIDRRGVQLIHDWIRTLASSGDADEGPRHSQSVGDTSASSLQQIATGSEDALATAVDQLTSTTSGALRLMHYLATDAVPPAVRRQIVARATQHPRETVRDLFDTWLPAHQRTERLGTNIDIETLLSMRGNAVDGEVLFFRDGATSCKSCHRVGNKGQAFGPDLSEIGRKFSPRQMLEHVLEPSKVIDRKYVPHVIETDDGRIHSGLLHERSDAVVVLMTPPDSLVRINVADIEEMTMQQRSLMPDQLLRDLTLQQAADLLAFLVSLR